MLGIQTEAKLNVDFKDWAKSIIDQHFLLKIDILHLLRRDLVFHPRLSKRFVFSFSLCCAPSHLHIYSSLDCLLICQRNMAYTSPHRSRVCQSRTIKFDSVTHSPFLFIVLVIIAKTQVILYLCSSL